MKAPICPSKVTLGRLLSKSAYKVDFLWDKWLLNKRFLLYYVPVLSILRRIYPDS